MSYLGPEDHAAHDAAVRRRDRYEPVLEDDVPREDRELAVALRWLSNNIFSDLRRQYHEGNPPVGDWFVPVRPDASFERTIIMAYDHGRGHKRVVELLEPLLRGYDDSACIRISTRNSEMPYGQFPRVIGLDFELQIDAQRDSTTID